MVHAALCKYVFRAADSFTHTNCSAQNAAPCNGDLFCRSVSPVQYSFLASSLIIKISIVLLTPPRVCQLCRCSVKSDTPKWRSGRKIPKTYSPSTSNTTRWLGLHRRASTKCIQRRLVNSPAAAIVARGSVVLETHEVAHPSGP